MADSRYVKTVERRIPASAAEIFALISDPSRHPELDGSGMVKGLAASESPLQLGSTFSMSMRRGLGYQTTNTVVAYEPDRVIAWRTQPTSWPLPLLVGGRIWRYDLEPLDGTTLVRETWDITHERNRWLVTADAGIAVAGMRASLERLERLVT